MYPLLNFSSFTLTFFFWTMLWLESDVDYCVGSSYGIVLSNAFSSWCVSSSSSYLVSGFMKFSLCCEHVCEWLYVQTILVVSPARFHDYEDMLEDTWHIDFSRRSDMSDTFYPNVNGGLPMWESYPVFSTKPKKEEKVGLAEAITNSILSTGNCLFFFFFFSFYVHIFEALFNCSVLCLQVA